MSPSSSRQTSSEVSFPRVSGDEPDARTDDTIRLVFSPRERG